MNTQAVITRINERLTELEDEKQIHTIALRECRYFIQKYSKQKHKKKELEAYENKQKINATVLYRIAHEMKHLNDILADLSASDKKIS
ncbi:MAG: hypothetical protein ACQEUT_18350 [Bacillota bacterium]